MRTWAWAELTWASAVRSASWASSNLARDVQPPFNSSCWRPKASRAWVSVACAEARLAWAERSAFCWFWEFEPGNDLTCRDHVAQIGVPFDHPPVETEGEVELSWRGSGR